MKLSAVLEAATVADRTWLTSAPVIRRALEGDVTRELYIAFLTQAYHHVRHTVPLMMAAGARLSATHPWLQSRIAHYIGEELGHDEWILSDIRAAGGDADAAAASVPAPATDAMVGFAWDVVSRRNPVGFFGMVHVLEGTSVALALRAAARIGTTLGLPPAALTYLTSHGRLDQEHVHHLADILDRLDQPADRTAVVDGARTFYWLYGNVFRSLDAADTPERPLQRRIA